VGGQGRKARSYGEYIHWLMTHIAYAVGVDWPAYVPFA
jgi:hypothetical protein